MQGWKDPRVFRQPWDCVKVDRERVLVQSMHEGAGYHAKQGVINIEVNREALLPRAMTNEECKSCMVSRDGVNKLTSLRPTSQCASMTYCRSIARMP